MSDNDNDDRKLAEAHVDWYMRHLEEQMKMWLALTRDIAVDNFVHGIKHGRELERE